MYAQVEKPKANKSRVDANSIAQKKSNGKQGFVFVDNRSESIVQRKMQLQASISSSLPIQKKENKTGLPDNLKSGIENLSGYSMEHVKVHYNSNKPAQIQSYAYAQGADIHVASGQEKHLPHEAWHVVQQRQGRVKPTMQVKGVDINDDAGLEREADIMGDKALSFSNSNMDANGTSNSKKNGSALDSNNYSAHQRVRFSNTNSFYRNPIPPEDLPLELCQSFIDHCIDNQDAVFMVRLSPETKDWVGRYSGIPGAPENVGELVWVEVKTADWESIHLFALYKNWHDNIIARNKYVMDVIKWDGEKLGGIREHPWFLMDYDDIVNNQAEVADREITSVVRFYTTALRFYTTNQRGNLFYSIAEGIKNRFKFLLSPREESYLPLVSIREINFKDYNGRYAVCVDYSINPQYKKFVDISGDEAVQILGDSIDSKYKTDISFISGNLTVGDATSQVGRFMEANVLSQDHPIGSKAGLDSAQNQLMGNLCKSDRDNKKQYIKGHLLNDHLGGPARPYNLFPITAQANSDHLVFIEKYVKAEVAKGYVMYYKVSVENVDVTDRNPGQNDHLRRYTVQSVLKAESAKIAPNQSPIEKHQITVKSDWGSQEVLDSTGCKFISESDTSTSGVKLRFHSDYTRKITPDHHPNKEKANPVVKDPDPNLHMIYKKSGYNQNRMNEGELSNSNFTSV